MTDRETINVYNAKAEEYDRRFSGGEVGAHLRRFLEAVPAGGHVLDLGCGPGNSATHMQSAGLEVTCLDASEEMVRAARSRGLNARVATFDEIEGEAVYDGIWANFSLLHAPRADLPRHLEALSLAMKHNAAFHIGMKLGEGTHRDGLGRKYTFVTEDELVGLLADAGIAAKTRTLFEEVGLAGTKDQGIVILGQKDA